VDTFTLHGLAGSPYVRSVAATLIEKGSPFRFAPVAPGTFRSAQHLARHPFGKVPAFDHGDFALYETQAILRYLDRILPDPALTPTDPHEAARMDQAMAISDNYLFNGVASVIGFQRVVGPALMGLIADEALCAQAVPKGQVVFGVLSDLLGDHDYLAGSMLTLADLLVAPCLGFLAPAPEWAVLTEGRENLVAWLARIEARESMQRTTWQGMAALAKAAA